MGHGSVSVSLPLVGTVFSEVNRFQLSSSLSRVVVDSSPVCLCDYRSSLVVRHCQLVASSSASSASLVTSSLASPSGAISHRFVNLNSREISPSRLSSYAVRLGHERGKLSGITQSIFSQKKKN
ncbi:hypothetical protein U1Q18_033153 [Sarracenia purpurea var. burkii]